MRARTRRAGDAILRAEDRFFEESVRVGGPRKSLDIPSLFAHRRKAGTASPASPLHADSQPQKSR